MDQPHPVIAPLAHYAMQSAEQLAEVTRQRDELVKALENLIPRFEACCRHSGSDEEYVKASTEMHRAALAKYRGGK